MKAAEITDATVEAILSGKFDHVRVNFANGDMVGHTGDLEATRIAVEAVDLQLARLQQAVHATQGLLVITADHGNADEMWMRDKKSGQVKRDARGAPVIRPSHTLNPVPFLVYDPLNAVAIPPLQGPISLAAVGTTVLELCGLQAPADYLPGIVTPRPT
jgi:2,3-bisphosphoglycerate-independent phosphoglycerate mutase